MLETYEYVMANKLALVGIVSLLINLFCAVAALTSTKKDDAVADWIKAAFGRFFSIR